MDDHYPMMQTGKEKLEKELAYLRGVKRNELDQQIKEARQFCDVSEDVSFKDMMNERTALDERIHSLQNMLNNAKLIHSKEEASSVITLGSSVTFVELPGGEKETYTIVGTVDANPSDHKISSESPLAKNLLGYQEDDEVTIQTPGGEMKVTIVRVH